MFFSLTISLLLASPLAPSSVLQKRSVGKDPCMTRECQIRKIEIAQQIEASIHQWNPLWLPDSSRVLAALRRMLHYQPLHSRDDDLDILDEITWKNFDFNLLEPQTVSTFLSALLENEDATLLFQDLWARNAPELAWLQFQIATLRQQVKERAHPQLEQRIRFLEQRQVEIATTLGSDYHEFMTALAHALAPALDLFFDAKTTTFEDARVVFRRHLARLHEIRIFSGIDSFKDPLFFKTLLKAEQSIHEIRKKVIALSDMQYGTLGLIDFYGPKNTLRRLEEEFPTLERRLLLHHFFDDLTTFSGTVFGYAWGSASLAKTGLVLFSSLPQWLKLYSDRSLYEWIYRQKSEDLRKRMLAIQKNYKTFESLEKKRLELLEQIQKMKVEDKRKLEQ